jgi:hypothetical protein
LRRFPTTVHGEDEFRLDWRLPSTDAVRDGIPATRERTKVSDVRTASVK